MPAAEFARGGVVGAVAVVAQAIEPGLASPLKLIPEGLLVELPQAE
jgi:phage tail protein X